MELRVGETRVGFQNYWRSYEFQWSEVEAVGMGSVMSLPAVAFILKNHKVRAVQVSSYSRSLREAALGMAETFAPRGVSVRGNI